MPRLDPGFDMPGLDQRPSVLDLVSRSHLVNSVTRQGATVSTRRPRALLVSTTSETRLQLGYTFAVRTPTPLASHHRIALLHSCSMLSRVTRMFRDNVLRGSNRPLGHSGYRRWTLGPCSSRAPRVTVRAMSDTAASPESEHPQRLSKEDQDFWKEVLETIDKPAVAEMVKNMHTEHPLGWDKDKYLAERRSNGKTDRSVTVNHYPTFLEHKLRHPKCVIAIVPKKIGETFEAVGYDALLLIGETFETVGYDALLLMQHCNSQPLAALKKIPRASCTLNSMPHIVTTLNAVGFSVVIIKEDPDDSEYGSKPAARKSRSVFGISTPVPRLSTFCLMAPMVKLRKDFLILGH
eukprot:gene19910-26613_t